MIYYRIPVIRDIVKLRAGAGVGVWGIMIFSTSVSRAKTRSFPMSMRVSIESSAAAVIWNSSSVRPWCYARRSSIIRLSGLEGERMSTPGLPIISAFALVSAIAFDGHNSLQHGYLPNPSTGKLPPVSTVMGKTWMMRSFQRTIIRQGMFLVSLVLILSYFSVSLRKIVQP